MRNYIAFGLFGLLTILSLLYIFTPLPTPKTQAQRSTVNISEVCANQREVSSETCTLVKTIAQFQRQAFVFRISSDELTALRNGRETPFVISRMIRFSIYLLAKHATEEMGEKEIGEGIKLKAPYLLDHYFGTKSQTDERRVAVRQLYDLSNSERVRRLCKHVLART